MTTSTRVGPPAPRPCDSCPYRRDVPSGVWDHEEYEKLRRYDLPTMEQPAGLFQCHQHGSGSDRARMCAGWAGCHDGDELLALRFGLIQRQIDAATFEATVEYVSPVPLFSSGNEAADHGQAEISNPGDAAREAIEKLRRIRGTNLPGDSQ